MFDKENGIIIISEEVYWPNFYMDYKTNCIKKATNQYVVLDAQQACINYIKHFFTKDRYMEVYKQNKYLDDWLESKQFMEDSAVAFSFDDFINAVDQVRGYTE